MACVLIMRHKTWDNLTAAVYNKITLKIFLHAYNPFSVYRKVGVDNALV